MFATLVHGTPDGLPFTNGRCKSEKRLRLFERGTTAMTDCLVDIPGSPRTNPNTGAQAFWLRASDKTVIYTHFVYEGLVLAWSKH